MHIRKKEDSLVAEGVNKIRVDFTNNPPKLFVKSDFNLIERAPSPIKF